MDTEAELVVNLQQVCTRFGAQVVHEGLDLQVRRGEIFALVGGSGSGKSTLLREMILLQQPQAGRLRVLGVDLHGLRADAALALRQRWGVLFQHGGLFGALTVRQNVGLPLREHSALPDALIDALADWKLALTGLPAHAGDLMPAELSGGMRKRASFARALALDPELLFLDEPTAGLDPVAAAGVDSLVRSLRDLFGLTIVMITHDLDLLWQTTDRVAVLAEGRVLASAPMAELQTLQHPAVRALFDGARGRSARAHAHAHANPGPNSEVTAHPAAPPQHGSAPSKPR